MRVSSYDYLAGVSYFVECFDCCEGPWHTTKVGAVNIWNKRAKRKMWNKREKFIIFLKKSLTLWPQIPII